MPRANRKRNTIGSLACSIVAQTVRVRSPENVPAELGPCLLYTGALGVDGYPGNRRVDGRHVRGHVAVFRHFAGRLTARLNTVAHVCDRRSCVNHLHMFRTDPAGNAYDRHDKDRSCWGDAHPNCKVSEAEMDEVESMLAAGWTMKECGIAYGVTANAIWYRVHSRERRRERLARAA